MPGAARCEIFGARNNPDSRSISCLLFTFDKRSIIILVKPTWSPITLFAFDLSNNEWTLLTSFTNLSTNQSRPKPFYFWNQCWKESDPTQNDSEIEFLDRFKIDWKWRSDLFLLVKISNDCEFQVWFINSQINNMQEFNNKDSYAKDSFW